MIFDKNIYFSFLKNEDIDGATNYLEDCAPDYLIKFYSLSEDKDTNKKKFDTLSADMNWYDVPEHQNDPFDMKLAYVDEELAKAKEACPEAVETAKVLLGSLQRGFALCSFIDTNIDNFPMWAFYANNHQGYCVRYKVNRKKIVSRVFYEKESETKHLEFFRHILFTSLNCKHISWKNENEYRIICPVENNEGLNLSNKTMGLTPIEVYMGINCSLKNQKRIIDICNNKLQCRAYKGAVSGKKFLEFEEVM